MLEMTWVLEPGSQLLPERLAQPRLAYTSAWLVWTQPLMRGDRASGTLQGPCMLSTGRHHRALNVGQGDRGVAC